MFHTFFSCSIFRFRLPVIFLLQALIFSGVSAQDTSSVDSLENLLSTSKDTTRVILLNALSEIYGKTSSKKAMPYAQEALSLSEELNFKSGIAISYRTIAIAYFFNNDHPKALECLLTSASKAAAIENWNLEAQNYLNVAAIHASVFGHYSNAMEYYTKALTVFESHNI